MRAHEFVRQLRLNAQVEWVLSVYNLSFFFGARRGFLLMCAHEFVHQLRLITQVQGEEGEEK